MFDGPFSHSIIKRALDKKIVEIDYRNIRDFGLGKQRMVDDTPYGGGAGMLLRVDVLDKAIQASQCKKNSCKERVILLDAGGKTFTQQKAALLANTYTHLIFICAHYEGVDDRIRTYIDEEISIGDYVITGGELPAMLITDAIVRLLPGVLGKDISSLDESFQSTNEKSTGLLEYPQYTRPALYKGSAVPDILLSGHHKNITKWRKDASKNRTEKNRPDLLTSKPKR